jgi:hypothetical protein
MDLNTSALARAGDCLVLIWPIRSSDEREDPDSPMLNPQAMAINWLGAH